MLGLGSVVIIMGIIILFVWKEYFIGILSTILGILIALNLGTTWDNKLVSCGVGILFLIGGILFFFFPELISNPNLSKYSHYTAGTLFTIAGICIIFRGLID